MRVLTSHRIDRCTRGARIVALVALAWAVFAPGGVFWTAVVAAGVIGSAIVTAVLVRRRSIPTLAEVITSAETEPVVVAVGGAHTGGASLRPRGDEGP